MNEIDTVRRCPAPDCGKPLERRVGESPGKFEARRYCGRPCARLAQRLPEEHGTLRGVGQHKRDGTKLCRACLGAQNEQFSAWRKNNPRRAAFEKARYDATKQLIDMHKPDYRRLCFAAYAKAGLLS